jgi:hypothetical protein
MLNGGSHKRKCGERSAIGRLLARLLPYAGEIVGVRLPQIRTDCDITLPMLAVSNVGM